MQTCTVFFLVFFVNYAHSRDFYMGMFKKNDFLVGSDTLYKGKLPFQHQVVKYGRLFKCPISYFRVSDRLGVGNGPRVQIIRGGLRHKYIVAKITGGYNLPIALNVYVGCSNTKTTKTGQTKPSTSSETKPQTTSEPMPITTSETIPPTTSETLPTTSSETKPTTSSETIPTTSSETIPTTSSESETTTSITENTATTTEFSTTTAEEITEPTTTQ